MKKLCKLCEKFEVNSIGSYAAHLGRKHSGNRIWDTDKDFIKAQEWSTLSLELKRKILFDNSNNSCEECGYNKTRKCGSIILEIDHVDGDHKNNKRENLRVLCPNCHALTENFRNWGRVGRNKSSSRVRRENKDFEEYQNERIKLDDLKKAFNQKFIEIVNDTHETKEIDYSKFGWVNKISEKFDESPQVTGRRIRRLMPEFYDEHCFRRGYSKYKNLNAGVA